MMSLDLALNPIFLKDSRRIRTSDRKENIFVSFSSSQLGELVSRFDEIVLTAQEYILYDALRFIEPKIERIASTRIMGSEKGQRGGFVVAIDGQRVPIGSMGDGIWRMLEITLAMVNVSGGILLIDEIDTGLHFSLTYSPA
jgi:AAA domain, putative AbiEii toxin, Type IV TA system